MSKIIFTIELKEQFDKAMIVGVSYEHDINQKEMALKDL